MFRCVLGPRSFDSSKRFLIHKQAFCLITFGGIRFISITTIASIVYLGNWTLVALIITTRFMVDHHPFFFKALTRIDNNTLLFQQHLKATCDLLPPPTHMCFPLFKQFIRQQMVQLQDSILECLHHHMFSNMFCERIFEAHCVQIYYVLA